MYPSSTYSGACCCCALGYVTHTQDEYNVRLKRPSGALIKALIRVQSLEKSNIHCAYR